VGLIEVLHFGRDWQVRNYWLPTILVGVLIEWIN
jgi:hypothetical protein